MEKLYERQIASLNRQLTDALDRAQTNTWQDYVQLKGAKDVMANTSPDTGMPDRGLSDDEELNRLGFDAETVEETKRLLMGTDSGIHYES